MPFTLIGTLVAFTLGGVIVGYVIARVESHIRRDDAT